MSNTEDKAVRGLGGLVFGLCGAATVALTGLCVSEFVANPSFLPAFAATLVAAVGIRCTLHAAVMLRKLSYTEEMYYE